VSNGNPTPPPERQPIRLQNVTITNNYFSGSAAPSSAGTSWLFDVVFTDNTFGTDLKPVWALYDWNDGSGNLWRRNKRVPGRYSTSTADDGRFWWPNGTKSTTDYAN
jgi:hypothetical protein